jgi:hypothetical protein
MSLYDKGYRAGRKGLPCDAENPRVNQWFAAGWYDGNTDRTVLGINHDE